MEGDDWHTAGGRAATSAKDTSTKRVKGRMFGAVVFGTPRIHHCSARFDLNYRGYTLRSHRMNQTVEGLPRTTAPSGHQTLHFSRPIQNNLNAPVIVGIS